MLTERQLAEFRTILRERFLAEREAIRQALLAADDQSFSELAGRVGDLENSALADLLVDVRLADIDRHVEAIRDIDTALLRIAGGSYGQCIDCEEPIDTGRLQAYPTAKRCKPCQVKYEDRRREPPRSTSL